MNTDQLIDILEQCGGGGALAALTVQMSVVLKRDHNDYPVEVAHNKVESIALDNESRQGQMTLSCYFTEPDHDGIGVLAEELLALCHTVALADRKLPLYAGANLGLKGEYDLRIDTQVIGHGIDVEEGCFMLLVDPPPKDFVNSLARSAAQQE